MSNFEYTGSGVPSATDTEMWKPSDPKVLGRFLQMAGIRMDLPLSQAVSTSRPVELSEEALSKLETIAPEATKRYHLQNAMYIAYGPINLAAV